MSNTNGIKKFNLIRLNKSITVAYLSENEYLKQFLQYKEGIFEEGLPDENNNSYSNNNENSIFLEEESENKNKTNIFNTSIITFNKESQISANQTYRDLKTILDNFYVKEKI